MTQRELSVTSVSADSREQDESEIPSSWNRCHSPRPTIPSAPHYQEMTA